jgi:hypothetical protein
MQKWFGFFLTLVLLTIPTHAGAQVRVKLASVNIELWSEYDQPSMLVIHEFIVAQETPLPARLMIRFPKEANLIAVAFESNGTLFNTQFESPAEQGDWQTITLNVESYNPYRIEYYQELVREENKRSFTFQWFGDYYVHELNLNLVIPADSIELITSPVLSNIELSNDERILVGTDTKSNLKMGNTYQFQLEYARASDALSDPNQANQIQPSKPIGPDTPGRVSVGQLPWIIGGIGIALIGFALAIYWRSTRGSAENPKRSTRRKQQVRSEQPTLVYCHECGARSNAGDRFCRTCGSRLRVE